MCGSLPGCSAAKDSRRWICHAALQGFEQPACALSEVQPPSTHSLRCHAATPASRLDRAVVPSGQAFDELLLLKRGGYCIYCGPLGGESVHLVDYFEAIPGVPGLKSGINPATWVLEVSTPGSEEQFGADFAFVYRNSGLFKCGPAWLLLITVMPAPGIDRRQNEAFAC